jgi:hypothetical protein
VRVLLAAFHEDTAHKLAIAPIDSRPTIHGSDGMLAPLDDDGFPDRVDGSDEVEAISARPTSVRDTETP